MGLFKLFNRNNQSQGKGDLAVGFASKKELTQLVKKKSGIVVLEAGASGGEDTIEWASIPEIERVFAFEPVASSFKILNQNAKKNFKIKPFQLAISNFSGNTLINISENINKPNGLPSSSSLFKPTGHLDFHKHINFPRQEKILVTTIDDWAKDNQVDTIDVIWLDMQGGEHLALAGAKSILKTTSVIYSEVSLKPMYEGGLLYSDFKFFLDELGFKVEKEFLPWEDMGNVLFIRK